MSVRLEELSRDLRLRKCLRCDGKVESNDPHERYCSRCLSALQKIWNGR